MIEDEEHATGPIDLETLSVEDLRQRIETLKAEIRACESELEKKASHLSSANSLFGGID